MSIILRSRWSTLGQNLLFSFLKNDARATASFSTSQVAQIKEIIERKEGNVLKIEGKMLPSPREKQLLKDVHPGACPLCRTNLDVKHTDVLILSQFVRSDGGVLPRRITGLCKKQQKKVSDLIAMAQKAGLMSNLTPSTSKKDPTKRDAWKKYNTYFDETTIKLPQTRTKYIKEILLKHEEKFRAGPRAFSERG